MPQASLSQPTTSSKATSHHESSISSTSLIQQQQTNICRCSWLLIIENAAYSTHKETAAGATTASCTPLFCPGCKFGTSEKRRSKHIELGDSRCSCCTIKRWKGRILSCWNARMAVEVDDQDHHHPEHVKHKEHSTHRPRKIEILEREVIMLNDMLRNERDVHKVLKHAHRYPGRAMAVPGFVPPKVKEMLVELGEVDDEIAQLEHQISQLQADLTNEQAVNRELKPRNQLQKGNVTSQRQKVSFEAKTLHFISKAMKGDFTVNTEFSQSGGRIDDHITEGNGAKDGLSLRLNGSWQKPPVSPSKLSPRLNLPPKRDAEPRISFDTTPKSTPSSTDTDEHSHGQKSPSANKLSESIIKCLIFIYVRLHRATRQNELEKTGGSAASRSFRGDSAHVKAIQSLLKESRQQDPYGIFREEESVRRDIGPYKNLILFGCSSLDLKCLSSASFVPLLKNLRGLFSHLRKVDLGSLTRNQKLAFWINMYNACVMNGFLQWGVHSTPEKLLSLMNEATLNIGGKFLNAQAIENFILRKPSSSSETKDCKEDGVRQLYGLETHDPYVTFSLCCGTRSSPSVRIYTAEGVVAELERSKLEYLQASIMVTSSGKIGIPELLLKNMNDFAQDLESLVKWVCHQLPISGLLRKSMVDCLKGQQRYAVIEKISYDFEFQFLLANVSSSYRSATSSKMLY